jgi:hypothetical protein
MPEGTDPVPAFAFDAAKVDILLQQVAIANAVAVNTQAQWKNADNGVMSGLYAIKYLATCGNSCGPGFVDTSLRAGTSIHTEAQQIKQRLWTAFMREFTKGPGPAKEFLDRQRLLLQRRLKEIKQTAIEAKMVNQQVDDLLQQALFWTLTTKFTAEIALNILGIVPGGGVLGFIVRTATGLGYPVAVELINNWDKASAGKISILALWGLAKALANNLSSILTEQQTMGRAELHLVKNPQERAAIQQALRKYQPGRMRTPKAQIRNTQLKANANGVMLGGLNAGLTGISIYFAVTGSIESGNQYQEALRSL